MKAAQEPLSCNDDISKIPELFLKRQIKSISIKYILLNKAKTIVKL